LLFSKTDKSEYYTSSQNEKTKKTIGKTRKQIEKQAHLENITLNIDNMTQKPDAKIAYTLGHSPRQPHNLKCPISMQLQYTRRKNHLRLPTRKITIVNKHLSNQKK